MSENNKKLSLTSRIVIGMFAGIIVGILLKALFPDSTLVEGYLSKGLFFVVGQIFISSLQMLVVPLVFVSLVVGTCSLSDPSKLGRLGGKAVGLYLITTAIAITLAISLAVLVQPGTGIELDTNATYEPKAAPSLAQVIIDLFPTNPFNAFANGNMLQIIVFALLFGIAMALVGKPGERVKTLFEDFNEIIMKLVIILMNIAPYGVFALMAKLFAETSFETIFSLAKYFLLVLAVLFIHMLITYPIILKGLAGMSPLTFLKKMREVQIFGFSTASSNATMPVTLETVTKRLGVHNSVGSFTVPLGATINMDGTAIMQGVATVFIAQVYLVDLSMADYLMVVLTATLASVGTAGVPGVGMIMLAMVLGQVGLPVEGIGLIIGVDRLLDMTRTAVNVTGDAMVSVIVAKSEGALDEDVFNDAKADIDERNLS
ncbi:MULTISPECIES: dicarboxylate/amino acid:cation symporter [Idiomarinaceae]|uniref:Na+/H+-dicarboxylate symporter n=3 Tax=Pseudidiomarina TaxID=2800384 RepID=A0A317QCN2_9GAMM|nr:MULTISPECIES: dicarboxylate/amino acid:cation symporter [Idiomarinaceae]MDT7525268.1 dicarboxylate/amino acid:cation symporter [Pseudidiomarina sp. GXY010]MRJ41131.1 cation:dicarboxylase symporter family transporter [Idiomarina sp. FeN1]NCU56296.1 cation:dicarboxylase symporter family transporter [Idiomarina sp. FenA--70]NCU59315.1 cation:dicarboxylase symporter family transporter [Idiomarina sp. FenBw--71]PWW16131.1 Na+/H+-dicarboxylate symporter [Pseudidiomarina maritima]